MTIMLLLVVFLYAAYACGESVAILARYGGVLASSTACGYSFQNVTLTLSRFISFTFPPVIGYLIDQGISEERLIFLSYSCFAVGAICLTLVLLSRYIITEFYMRAIIAYNTKNMSLFKSFKAALVTKKDTVNVIVKSKGLNKKIFFYSFLIISIYSSMVLALNFLSHQFPENRGMILQFTGIFNGFGTILLTLFLDPLVAKYIDRKNSLDEVFYSALAGRICSYAIGAPLIFSLHIFFYS